MRREHPIGRCSGEWRWRDSNDPGADGGGLGPRSDDLYRFNAEARSRTPGNPGASRHDGTPHDHCNLSACHRPHLGVGKASGDHD
jgi:hypothetical protein